VTRVRAADDFAVIRARVQELRRTTRPRAADDFAFIRQRVEQLRRERVQAQAERAFRFGRGPETASTCREAREPSGGASGAKTDRAQLSAACSTSLTLATC
jgi:hypothetical protein